MFPYNFTGLFSMSILELTFPISKKILLGIFTEIVLRLESDFGEIFTTSFPSMNKVCLSINLSSYVSR